MVSSALTPQRHTAEAVVAAFNIMDVPAIMSHRAPNCTRTFLPPSMNIPPQNNTTYQASLQKLLLVFHNFSLTINDLLEDKEARKISLWLSARAETLAGEYVNEYVWLLEFNEEGKITASREFSDSVMEREFYPKLRDAMQQQQARGAI